MSNRFVMPVPTALTNSAQPGSGWKLQFYESGTTTPLDTYSDESLSSANSNPVVADSAGRFGNIFLKGQAYRVVLLTDANVEVWTRDDVYGVKFSYDTDDIGNASDIPGATATAALNNIAGEVIAEGEEGSTEHLDIINIPSAYRVLIFYWDSLRPENDDVNFGVRVGVGGSFDADSSDYNDDGALIRDGSVQPTGGVRSRISLSFNHSQDNQNRQSSGWITVHNRIQITGISQHIDPSVNHVTQLVGGCRNNAVVRDSLRFFYNSGDIANIRYRLVGIR